MFFHDLGIYAIALIRVGFESWGVAKKLGGFAAFCLAAFGIGSFVGIWEVNLLHAGYAVVVAFFLGAPFFVWRGETTKRRNLEYAAISPLTLDLGKTLDDLNVDGAISPDTNPNQRELDHLRGDKRLDGDVLRWHFVRVGNRGNQAIEECQVCVVVRGGADSDTLPRTRMYASEPFTVRPGDPQEKPLLAFSTMDQRKPAIIQGWAYKAGHWCTNVGLAQMPPGEYEMDISVVAKNAPAAIRTFKLKHVEKDETILLVA